MPAPKKYVMWVWCDAGGVIRYVGHGKPNKKDKHPAAVMWAARGGKTSALYIWLQTLRDEPKRVDISSQVPMSHDEIMAAVMALREKYKATLFDARPRETYKGGYPNRPVYGPDNAYASVRAAANAIGKDPATVTRWCQSSKKSKWGYVL